MAKGGPAPQLYVSLAARLFDNIYRKGVMLLLGFVLSCQALLWISLFRTVKWRNGLRAISKIMKWVIFLIVLCLWEQGALIQILWPLGLLL